jgi:ketosteroid isomerase-like protein
MDMTTPDRDIAAVLEAVRRGFAARDAGAITAFYTADAEIFDLAPPLSHAIDPAGLAAWLAGWGGPVEQTPHGMTTTISGDAAFCHGLVRVDTETKEGEARGWWMRATICLARRHGQWRIVHEHSSVPFYMDGSFRAAIDLNPERARPQAPGEPSGSPAGRNQMSPSRGLSSGARRFASAGT